MCFFSFSFPLLSFKSCLHKTYTMQQWVNAIWLTWPLPLPEKCEKNYSNGAAGGDLLFPLVSIYCILCKIAQQTSDARQTGR